MGPDSFQLCPVTRREGTKQSWQQTEREHGFDVGFPYTRGEVRNNVSSAAQFLPKAQDPQGGFVSESWV